MMEIKIEEPPDFAAPAGDDPFADNLEFMTVEELDREVGWPLPYTSTVGLRPYVQRLSGEPVGVEIGTGRAEGAYLLLDLARNIKKLVTVDPFREYMDWNGVIRQEKQDRFRDIAHQNLAKFGQRAEIMETFSVAAAPTFLDETLDFVYIDGDHSFDAVILDLVHWVPKVRKGGIVAIHDCNLGQVTSAIKEYRTTNRVNALYHKSSNGVHFWYR